MPRWGAVIRMPGGGIAFVDGSGPRGRRHYCACGKPATLQCDFLLLGGITCDAWLCRSCGVPVGPDVDYCRSHAVASHE